MRQSRVVELNGDQETFSWFFNYITCSMAHKNYTIAKRKLVNYSSCFLLLVLNLTKYFLTENLKPMYWLKFLLLTSNAIRQKSHTKWFHSSLEWAFHVSYFIFQNFDDDLHNQQDKVSRSHGVSWEERSKVFCLFWIFFEFVCFAYFRYFLNEVIVFVIRVN